MTDRNWEAELAKIDKQLASIPDEQLLATTAPTGKPGDLKRSPVMDSRMATQKGGDGARVSPPASSATAAPAKGAWLGWVKVTIAVGAAAGLMFWPWPARCGPALVGFTAATGAVALLGVWSAIGTWRHRLGLAHVASLLVIVWGMLLGAREILPRVGYAVPTELRSAGWTCDVAQPSTAPPSAPAPAPTGATGATGQNSSVPPGRV